MSRLATRVVWFVAVGALVAIGPGGAMAQEDPLYSMEESLDYRVKYGPAHLADLNVEIGCRSASSGRVDATLRAASRGMARRIHPFRVRLDTRTVPAGSGALMAQTWIREEGRLRRYRSRFDDAPRVHTTAEIFGSESTESAPLPRPGHDLLSWMLELREEVAQHGPRQEPQRYPLWDGWKLVWLEASPLEPTDRETPAGEFRAQPFELRRTELHHEGSERFEPRADPETLGTIWIGLEERTLPAAMDFEAPIGRVQIELVDHDRDSC